MVPLLTAIADRMAIILRLLVSPGIIAPPAGRAAIPVVVRADARDSATRPAGHR